MYTNRAPETANPAAKGHLQSAVSHQVGTNAAALARHRACIVIPYNKHALNPRALSGPTHIVRRLRIAEAGMDSAVIGCAGGLILPLVSAYSEQGIVSVCLLGRLLGQGFFAGAEFGITRFFAHPRDCLSSREGQEASEIG